MLVDNLANKNYYTFSHYSAINYYIYQVLLFFIIENAQIYQVRLNEIESKANNITKFSSRRQTEVLVYLKLSLVTCV